MPPPHDGRASEQFGARRTDHEQRPADVAHEAFEQVEQRLFRPVEVLEQTERPVARS
jgi:hypothetical protein